MRIVWMRENVGALKKGLRLFQLPICPADNGQGSRHQNIQIQTKTKCSRNMMFLIAAYFYGEKKRDPMPFLMNILTSLRIFARPQDPGTGTTKETHQTFLHKLRAGILLVGLLN